MKMSMNGNIIPGTPLCIDYWFRLSNKKYLRFLSHLHSDHTCGLTSTFYEKIYTSPFNAWLLHRWFNLLPEVVVPLTIGDTHILEDPTTEKLFNVTLFDAYHCPGSVMFLFQGEFGNILYTGDFRYRPDILEHPMLNSIVETESLHQLYLDNTFAAEHCEFPPRQKALSQLLSIIRLHPDHHILLGIRKLGKEEVLQTVALELNELVHVGEDRMAILSYLQYQKVFTTDPSQTRIYAKEIHLINSSYIHALQVEKGPVLTILLSALPFVVPSTSLTVPDGVHYVPYSDHSCYSELLEFVSKVKPHSIYPIVKPSQTNTSLAKRSESSNSNFFNNVWQNSIIPQSILKLCITLPGTKLPTSDKSLTSFHTVRIVPKSVCRLIKSVDNGNSVNGENHGDLQSKNTSNFEPSRNIVNISDEEKFPVSDEKNQESRNFYVRGIRPFPSEDQNEFKCATGTELKKAKIQFKGTSSEIIKSQEIINPICNETDTSFDEAKMSPNLMHGILSPTSSSRNSSLTSLSPRASSITSSKNASTDNLYATGIKEAIILLTQSRDEYLTLNASGESQSLKKFSDPLVNVEDDDFEPSSFYNAMTVSQPKQARSQDTYISNIIPSTVSSKLQLINDPLNFNGEKVNINTFHTNNLKIGNSESFFLHIDSVYKSWQETCPSHIDKSACHCNSLLTWQGTDWKTVFKQIDNGRK